MPDIDIDTSWIVAVERTESGSFKVTATNGDVMFVPDNTAVDEDGNSYRPNRHTRMVYAWIDEGNTPALYVAPPPPTPAERIATITGGSDVQTVMFKMLLRLHNRVLTLEAKPTISVSEFLTFLEGELS